MQRRAQPVGDDPVVVGTPIADVTAEGARLGAVEGEEAELLLRCSDPVELGDHRDRGVLELGLLLA